MHVGMYDCMRSDSESELGNHLSGILRKAKKQTNVLLCLCMYMSQLKGVRMISACVHARVCWYYFANLSTVSVCLPAHTMT